LEDRKGVENSGKMTRAMDARKYLVIEDRARMEDLTIQRWVWAQVGFNNQCIVAWELDRGYRLLALSEGFSNWHRYGTLNK
jgi:hypothetical protein